MTRIYLLFVFIVCFIAVFSQNKPSVHSYTVRTIKGTTISLNQYYGKKLMLVNTASFCGFTPQFTSLQALYKNYHQYDFEILGFPCNDFGAQEPYSDSTIMAFCANNYSVTFPMMSKISIAAGDTAPVYRWLQRANLNGKQNVSVAWNFGKFLINESGNWVGYYPSAFDPADTAITHWILSPSSLAGVDEYIASDPLKLISANPAAEQITFQINPVSQTEIKLSLIRLDGSCVKDFSNELELNKPYLELNISDIENGFYFLVTTGNGKRFAKKLIIQN